MWILSGFKKLIKHFDVYIMSIFVLNGKWVIHWRWLLQCTLCTWCESGVDDRHWGVPKFSIGLKSGLTSGQGFTFASLCSRKSLVYFAVCTQVLSCLISGFGVGGQKVAQEKVEEHCQYIGQLLYHSLNLDQYVETQWGQVEQSNAMLLGPPKEPLSSIQSSK